MMKKLLYLVFLFLIGLTSCEEDDKNLFDKSADERSAQAIATLKQNLIANPWKIKYQPETTSGSFWVLLDFKQNNQVTIRTDLGSNNGEFFEQTITYRIDSSLGLELIMESYSFFSFLFEQDQASFGAEYEFNFVNKTPDNALVFTSKTDFTTPTILVFLPATPADATLLGTKLSSNLTIMAGDLERFSSSLRLTFTNRNLIMYLSIDEFKRTIAINSASLKTDTQTSTAITFNSGYLVQGDSIIFQTPFNRNVLGNNINIKGIKLNTLNEEELNICATPFTIHAYQGFTSSNDAITLATTIADATGKLFAQESDFYFAPLQYIFDNGVSARSSILQDVAGALELHLYHNFEIGGGERLFGIGFVIRNSDGTFTFALREFTPVLTNNQITFNFKTGFRLFGNQQTDADLDNINIYLNALAEGNTTYIYRYSDGIYEFNNPCSGWTFILIDGN